MPAALPWALLWGLLAPAPTGSVELGGERATALWRARKPPPAPPPVATEREVELVPVPGGLSLRARWRLRAITPGWFVGRLVDDAVRVREIRIDGAPATATGVPVNTTVVARVTGSTEIELDAFVPGDPTRGLELALMPAIRGVARLRKGGDLRLRATEGGHAVRVELDLIGGDPRITIGPPEPDGVGDGTVVLGNVGIGLTVGDAEMRGRARLEWVIRRGQLDRVGFTASGVGDDLVVEGSSLVEFTRSGDRVDVALRGKETGKVALDVRWSAATPAGERGIAAPSFILDGVRRQDMAITFARDGDVDAIPQVDGWRAVAPGQLPVFGRDLVEGSVIAAFAGHGASRHAEVSLLRFAPVTAPPIVVDRARVRLAAADHGAVLVIARYEVANERASHLRLALPPGGRLLAVEVDGTEVRPTRSDRTLLVPIKRSLETLEGLISIPVVVSALVDGPAWRRRDRRRVPLPSVEAPIGRLDVELLLPRRWAARLREGEYGVVAIARESRTNVGKLRSRGARKTGSAAPPPPGPGGRDRGDSVDGSALDPNGARLEEGEHAIEFKDKTLREATRAYNANDFDTAQAKLDELKQRGVKDKDAEKLQSNLEMFRSLPSEPPPSAPASATGATFVGAAGVDVSREKARPAKFGLARRIREQARARARQTEIEQDQRRARIRVLRSKGQYEAAKKEIERSIKANEDLSKVSQQEQAADYEFADEELQGELKAVEAEAAARTKLESRTKLYDPSAFAGGELGLGGADAPPLLLDSPPGPATSTAPPANSTPPIVSDGPRVPMPVRGGDRIMYRFELVPPGAARKLEVAARRRLRPR